MARRIAWKQVFRSRPDNDFISALDVDEVTNRVYVAHAGQYSLGAG